MDELEIPPPPQKIFEQLNGDLIGHYIMKKALCVAIYNHYSDVSMKRWDLNGQWIFDFIEISLQKNCSWSKYKSQRKLQFEWQRAGKPGSDNFQFQKWSVGRKFLCFVEKQKVLQRFRICGQLAKQNRRLHDPNGKISQKCLAQILKMITDILEFCFQVSRVITEPVTHRVHLRTQNSLTFDPTGSSRPLDSIACYVAKFLGVPYIRADCKSLVPRSKIDTNLQSENRNQNESQILSSSNPATATGKG